MILAGIDIGTNTLRLLIADVDRHSLRILHSDRTITRLGGNLDRFGVLSAEARNRSLLALTAFSREIPRWRPAAVCAVGTSALRNAGNALQFIDQVREHTGLSIRVVSGEEEARLTLLGVTWSLRSAPAMVIDIGGGSTEIVSAGGSAEISLPLGAVYLTDRFITSDPCSPDDLAHLRREVQTVLIRNKLPRPDADPLVGTAGTITTLASMDLGLNDYDPDRITGHVLTHESIERMILTLSGASLAERKAIPGLEAGREDIILAGAIIADEIMLHFGYERMTVSDWGLREGIVIDLYDKMFSRN